MIIKHFFPKISDFNITPASKKGDHYATVIYRILINYFSSKTNSDMKKSIILKTEPYVEGNKKDAMSNADVFPVEIRMYSETLPEIQKALDSIGDETMFAPKLLYHSMRPAKMLIFEDISPSGFDTIKNFGVGDVLSKLAFHRLGQMHAVSMVLNQRSDNISSYKQSIFHLNFGGEGLYFWREFLKSLTDEIRTWPGYETYVEKLETIISTCNDQAKEMFKVNAPNEGYNVLNHGDFHSKNMMFKNMDSKDADIMLLDFQICYYGTPAIDLYMGLYMVTTCEDKEEFIQYYYKVFSETLEKLKYSEKIPTYDDLKNELYKYRFYEVLAASSGLAILTVDIATLAWDDLFDFEGKSAEVRKSLYQNPKVKEKFKKVLPEWLKRGVLD